MLSNSLKTDLRSAYKNKYNIWTIQDKYFCNINNVWNQYPLNWDYFSKCNEPLAKKHLFTC